MYQNFYELNSNDYNYKKINGPSDNYSGSMKKNHAYSNTNANANSNSYNHSNFDNNFQKTKNKINVIMFKNGFILNKGPFRDISIPQNRKFMEEVDKGLIPQELMIKGINDLEIILENRKNEVYAKKQMNPITSTLNAYIQGNQSNINYLHQNININQNINNMNYIQNDINKMNYNPGINTNVKINPPIILNQGQNFPYNFNYPDANLPEQMEKSQNYYPNYKINNNQNQRKKAKIDPNNMCLTPIGGRNNRKNVFVEKGHNEKEENFDQKQRESLSAPKKKEEKKIRTFASLIKEEKAKEEEEKKKKKAKKAENKKQEKEEEKKEEEKKFQAFTGTGQLIGNVNTEGLHVYKNVKNVVDQYSPICIFNVRLFNGEIVKCEFNYTQTLRDIYNYIHKISGSNNFYLLEGFPPKPLRDYNKSIGELYLDNTMLTQKIK